MTLFRHQLLGVSHWASVRAYITPIHPIQSYNCSDKGHRISSLAKVFFLSCVTGVLIFRQWGQMSRVIWASWDFESASQTKLRDVSFCYCYFSLSPFNSHFPDGSGLAGTRSSPLWIILEVRIMEVVVTTGAVRRAKLRSNHHHQQTNTQFFTGQMSFLSPNQQCQSTEVKRYY